MKRSFVASLLLVTLTNFVRSAEFTLQNDVDGLAAIALAPRLCKIETVDILNVMIPRVMVTYEALKERMTQAVINISVFWPRQSRNAATISSGRHGATQLEGSGGLYNRLQSRQASLLWANAAYRRRRCRCDQQDRVADARG